MIGYEKTRRALLALDFVRVRKSVYSTKFPNPGQDPVLKDLAKFCRASETTFHTDPRIQAMLEGRRQVWLRIQQHLNLAPDELFRLYGGYIPGETQSGADDE